MDRHEARIRHADATVDLAATAMGTRPADLIIRNARLADVLTGRMEDGVDILVARGFIAFIGDASEHPVGPDTREIDAGGACLIPGLIDSHMHVESSMVDLPSFAAGILPHGTTCICPDMHEMTNVFGLRAVELFSRTAEGLPLKVLPAMPVCVPSIPGMEDAGASIGPEEAAEAYAKGWADLQGEQMNFPGVVYGDPTVHGITAEGLRADKVLTGHFAAPGLGKELNAFIAAGMTACHESTRADEALLKASRGMYVQQRYGSAWLDLPNLVPAVLENPEMDTRMFAMVTDDVTPATIAEEGHLIRVLREAVRLGVPAMKALQMVTINPAQLLEASRWIGSVSPGRAADLVLVDDMKDFRIRTVVSDGMIVADGGELKVDIPRFDYPSWATGSVHLPRQTAEDFHIEAPPESPGEAEVRIVRMIPGMVYTEADTAVMPVTGGRVDADPGRDIAKLFNLYRHEAPVDEAHRRAAAFVTGLNLDPHTAYASTVAHDCHNMIVIGTDDESMAAAANSLTECGGGLVVVRDGAVLARMELPFAGLMSLKSVREAAGELAGVEKALRSVGCVHGSAEMTISLLGLIVLGELHLSNRGLVELKPGSPPRFVNLFLTRE